MFVMNLWRWAWKMEYWENNMESWFMLLQYGTLHGPTSTSCKRHQKANTLKASCCASTFKVHFEAAQHCQIVQAVDHIKTPTTNVAESGWILISMNFPCLSCVLEIELFGRILGLLRMNLVPSSLVAKASQIPSYPSKASKPSASCNSNRDWDQRRSQLHSGSRTQARAA